MQRDPGVPSSGHRSGPVAANATPVALIALVALDRALTGLRDAMAAFRADRRFVLLEPYGSVFERVELREKPPLPVLARLITS